MSATRDLKLVFCIVDETTRHKFHTLLQDLIEGGKLAAQVPNYRFEMGCCETRKQATECVRRYLIDGEDHAAILAFDIPAVNVRGNREINEQEASGWAEEVRGEIKANCGTIAIMESPRRLP